MKKLLLGLLLVIGVVANGIEAKAAEDCITINVTKEYKYDEAYKLAEMINDYRVENGLSAIPVDAGLMERAMEEAVSNALFNSHTLTDGTPGTACNVYVTAGNITAEAAFKKWESSTGHNKNMLRTGKYNTRMGVGVVANSAVLIWSSDIRIVTGVTTKLSNKTVTTKLDVAKKFIESVSSDIDVSEDPDLIKASVGTTYDVGDDYFKIKLDDGLDMDRTWDPYIDWDNFSIYSTNEKVLTIDGRIATVQGSGTCKIVYQLKGTDFKDEYEVTINCPDDGEDKEEEENKTQKKIDTVENTKISKPAVSKKRSGKNTKLTIKFTKTKKFSGAKYQIKVFKDKKCKTVLKSKSTKNNQWKVTINNKKYKKVYIKVRCYKKINGKTYYGKWSKVKTVKTR